MERETATEEAANAPASVDLASAPASVDHAQAPATAIALPELVAQRVVGGTPMLEPSEAPELAAVMKDQPGGTAVRLNDAAGRHIAWGILDPANSWVRVWPRQGGDEGDEGDEEGLTDGFFRRRIAAAAVWRKRLGLIEPESAYRLINAEGDGLAGFTVDVYAGHALLFTYAEELMPWAEKVAAAVVAELTPHSVTAKIRPAGETPTGRVEYRTLTSTEPPKQLIVREDDARYEVHLLGGLNTGLFLDMREVRRLVKQLAPKQRVLNAFAYTGSFSVVAARAGARSVTTVEFAGGVVEWAKTNFALNELPTDGKRFKFVKDDVFEFLKTARRRGDLWDFIILDPPIATSAPGRKWYMKSDYDRLIGHALRVLAPGGVMLVAASTLQSRPEGIENQIRHALRDQGRRGRLVASFGLPADFPTQMIHPQGRYLKCFFVEVE